MHWLEQLHKWWQILPCLDMPWLGQLHKWWQIDAEAVQTLHSLSETEMHMSPTRITYSLACTGYGLGSFRPCEQPELGASKKSGQLVRRSAVQKHLWVKIGGL